MKVNAESIIETELNQLANRLATWATIFDGQKHDYATIRDEFDEHARGDLNLPTAIASITDAYSRFMDMILAANRATGSNALSGDELHWTQKLMAIKEPEYLTLKDFRLSDHHLIDEEKYGPAARYVAILDEMKEVAEFLQTSICSIESTDPNIDIQIGKLDEVLDDLIMVLDLDGLFTDDSALYDARMFDERKLDAQEAQEIKDEIRFSIDNFFVHLDFVGGAWTRIDPLVLPEKIVMDVHFEKIMNWLRSAPDLLYEGS